MGTGGARRHWRRQKMAEISGFAFGMAEKSGFTCPFGLLFRFCIGDRLRSHAKAEFSAIIASEQPIDRRWKRLKIRTSDSAGRGMQAFRGNQTRSARARSGRGTRTTRRGANDATGRERRDGARTALEMQAAWPWQPRGCERRGGAQASLGTRATCKLMDGPKAGGRPGNAGDAALRGRMRLCER